MDIRPIPQGYEVTYWPAKQRGHIKPAKFIIPRGGPVDENPSPAHVIDIYLQVLNKWVSYTPEKQFFYTGTTPMTAAGSPRKSRFIDSYLGINTLRAVGQDIARHLNLTNWKRYTGNK